MEGKKRASLGKTDLKKVTVKAILGDAAQQAKHKSSSKQAWGKSRDCPGQSRAGLGLLRPRPLGSRMALASSLVLWHCIMPTMSK